MMNTREIYRRKYEAQIKEWTAKLDELKARSQKLTAGARLELQPGVDRAHASLETAKAGLERLTQTGEEGWEDLRRECDRTWKEVKAAVEGAYDAVAGHAH